MAGFSLSLYLIHINMEFDKNDLQTIREKGKTPERVLQEMEMLKKGFPYLEIAAPATVGNGILKLTPEVEKQMERCWLDYLAEGTHTIMKMVPASGAASRMFKELLSYLNDKDKPMSESLKVFFRDIEKFAFFRRLNLSCITLYQKNIDEMLQENRHREVLDLLLNKKGLNYAKMPKAMLMFHKILGSTRTAIEEHLAEAAQYATDKNYVANVHFTVSPEHLALIKLKLQEVGYLVGHRYGVKFNVTFSVQKNSTDTIAVNLDGTPFRNEKGEILFRPGGHGALIENLNELDADVIFIKNIDNIVPDQKRYNSNYYKAVLAGTLVEVKSRIDKYMRILDGNPTPLQIDEMLNFLRTTLCITHDGAEALSFPVKVAYVRNKLNRPLRVCGMVKNEGEPGGGPFMVYDAHDETIQPQILELSQIDTDDPQMQKMLAGATHFNPVDLVVAIKDYKGRKYNLSDYVNHNTGFISSKSYDGRELKALELPGLWNGSMSDWNTVFVEVPAETFNPVKVVNDLLRPAHQVDHF